MPKIAQVLAENLKRLRKLRGYETQEEFAKALGISRAVVANYESAKGGFSADTLAKMAKLLKVDETDLVSGQLTLLEAMDIVREFFDAVKRGEKPEIGTAKMVELWAKKKDKS